MILQIRNMESERCIAMVKNELNKLELQYKAVELGEVELINNISTDKLHLIDSALNDIGLEIIEDRDSKLIEKIKTVVYEFVHSTDEQPKTNISDYIREKIRFDYTLVSKIFSNNEGITIQKYVNIMRIEYVKDLLLNSELNLNDIAFKLKYSSVAHLSNQFKKLTGYTPSHFGKLYHTLRNKKLECVNDVTNIQSCVMF